MRKNLLAVSLLFAAALVLVFAPGVLAFAQDAIPYPQPADQIQALVIAVFAAVLPIGVAVVRKALPTLPRIVVWGLAPAGGALLGYLTSLGGMTGWKGFAAGLAAIAVRELVDTLKEHGVNG
ncbi:MAG TPA: hypothetical protein VI589_06980 [Vicinamibacteria bacterium]